MFVFFTQIERFYWNFFEKPSHFTRANNQGSIEDSKIKKEKNEKSSETEKIKIYMIQLIVYL